MATIKHIQTPDGVTHDIGGGGGSTTYTLTKSGSTITLTGSGGDVSSVVDANTTYALSLSGHTLTLTPSSGSAQSVTIPDDNTTYTIGISGTTITLTPSSGTAQTITIPDATTSTAGVMSASDKTKLDGIQSGAEVNVQADWNQSNSSADDYIKNKPSLATVATTGDYDDLTNKPSLATVATTGDYDDLIDKPTIPTVNNGTLTIQKNGSSVGTFTANQSGNSTANITVPTAVSDLTNDSGFTSVSVTQTLSSGTKIGDITVDGTTTDLYAPSGGSGGVSDVLVDNVSVVTGGVAEIDLTGKQNVISDIAFSSGTYSGGLADRKLLQSSTITLLEAMVNSGISDGIIDQTMQFLANFVGKFTFSDAGHFQVGTIQDGFYWRVNDINGTPWHQIRIQDDGRIVYEQYDGSTWTTIWTNMRGKSVRVWSGTLWPVVSQTGITWTDDGLWTSVTAVFSAYENGAAQGYAWHCYTVPREYIRLHNGQGHTVILANSRFSLYGTKYIYFYLDHLGGNDNNDDGSYTARGMTAANNNFVIREVYLNY